jgi:hypothetical protein
LHGELLKFEDNMNDDIMNQEKCLKEADIFIKRFNDMMSVYYPQGLSSAFLLGMLTFMTSELAVNIGVDSDTLINTLKTYYITMSADHDK